MTSGESRQSDTPGQDNVAELAHVLFTDIVGFSKNSVERQRDLISRLQRLVADLPEIRENDKDKMIYLATGDGIAVAFFGDAILPLRCAQSLSSRLVAQGDISVRMGIHFGPVLRFKDIKDNLNLAGGGVNYAQRVMDVGDGGHILVSGAAAGILAQFDRFAHLLHYIGEATVKHGVTIEIYSAYGEDFGNPIPPSKLSKTSSLQIWPLRRKIAAVVVIAVVVGIAVWYSTQAGTPQSRGGSTVEIDSIRTEDSSRQNAQKKGQEPPHGNLVLEENHH